LGGASGASARASVGLVRDRAHLAALQVLHHDIAIRELALEKLRGLDGDLSAVSVRARLAVDGNFELRSLRYPTDPLRLPASRPARRGKFQPSGRMVRHNRHQWERTAAMPDIRFVVYDIDDFRALEGLLPRAQHGQDRHRDGKRDECLFRHHVAPFSASSPPRPSGHFLTAASGAKT
jgi:hypothetical protein